MMHQTLQLSFNGVLRCEIEAFLQYAHRGMYVAPDVKELCLIHSATLLRAANKEELLAVAGFTELELGLPTDHGYGRWTYAQHTMAHSLARAGWLHRQIGAAIGKSKNAVTGLLYRGTPWKTVADTRAGSWSQGDTETVLHLRDAIKLTWRGIGEAMGYSDVYCRLRYREAKNRKPEEPFVARV